MIARNRRWVLFALAAAAAVVVGVTLGYQPASIGIHPAPTTVTASSRVPLGLRQGPTSRPAYVPHPAGNPPATRPPAYTPTPAGSGGAADGPANRRGVDESSRRPVGSGGSPSGPTTSAAQPPTTIPPPTTTTSEPTTSEPTTTTVAPIPPDASVPGPTIGNRTMD